MEEIQNFKPSLVVWEITLKCNLKCIHCGSSAGKARHNELTTEESLRLCQDIAELGFKGVTLFGGEPFLREDWSIIGKKIKDLGLKLSVVSNGFVNPQKIIPKLVNLEFDSVQVGLDGAFARTHDNIRNVSGSFDKAVGFLQSCKEAGLPSGFITTVSKMNFKELPIIKELVIENEVDWQVQEAIPIGRFPKEMILSEEEYYALGLFIASTRKDYSSMNIFVGGPHNLGFHSRYIPDLGSSKEWKGCWAGKMILGIQSDGCVKGCLALPDDFIEGNIRDKNLINIFNDPKSFEYNRRFDKDDLGENCKACEYGETCKGGCLTRSRVLTGFPRNDPYCFHRIEKRLFKDSMD